MTLALPPASTAVFAATGNLPECDYPYVHFNGTGRDTLLREYQAANNALNAFCYALAQVTCHERDYYPHGLHAFLDAKRTRAAVFSLCDEIGSYLEDHIKHLNK